MGPFFDPDWMAEERRREEAAFARLMRDCFGSAKDPKRPIQSRSPSKLDPRVYRDEPWNVRDAIESLLDSL